jgi:GT2 family glycosyltransferase
VSFCNIPTLTTSPLLCLRIPARVDGPVLYAPVSLGYPDLVTTATGITHAKGKIFVLFVSRWNKFHVAVLRDDNLAPLFYQELPEIKDGHSMLATNDCLYVVSTGTDKVICYDIKEESLENPRVVWRASKANADTHHINSIAEKEGEIIVSAFGPKSGLLWATASNGYIHNITSDSLVIDGIYHPHSLSIKKGQIFYSDSHRNALCVVGQKSAIFELNGYTRGVSWLSDELIFVATSIGRRISKSTGLISNPADPGEVAGECSLLLGNISEKRIIRKTDLSWFGPEIYDVLVLQEVSHLDLLSLANISQGAERQVIQILSKQLNGLTEQLAGREKQVIALTELAKELSTIKSTRSWRIYVWTLNLLHGLFPHGSLQFKLFDLALKSIQEIYRNGFVSFLKKTDTRIKSAIWRIRRGGPIYRKKSFDTYLRIEPVSVPTKISVRECQIDIIVCVHNALEDVQRCLESVEKHTGSPYQLVIVDDGSSHETEEYLKTFVSGKDNCALLRNERAGGYTRAANKGLKFSKAEFVVLLNSDTIVGPEWLDRLYSAITSDDRNGVAGPLSNTASWQSIPELEDNGDWAMNPLPEKMSVAQMSENIIEFSGVLRPEAKLLNGFCMMIRQDVIKEIGYFDEDHFGEGYGEEDDFNLRVRKAGWKLVVADDVFIYHAQSKSYSHERRRQLYERAGQNLRNKHGVGIITESVHYMHPNRVMAGIRARSTVLTDRVRLLEQGRKEFTEKKVLFVLPIIDAGGGGNVVIDESRCMRKMGVDVKIFNLLENQKGFQKNYPQLDIPVVYGTRESLMHHSVEYDAIIATVNYSVEWLQPVREKYKHLLLGYYVQGFEVLMYEDGSRDAERALSSYTLIDDMRLFAKTEWVREMVLKHTGAKVANIGISVNTDLFRPRHARPLGQKPVVITAMVRPGSPYRSPKLTMDILRQIERKFKNKVDIRLFGSDDIRDPGLAVPTNFNWTQTGKLTQTQVANLLSDADVFIDFSSHQAMGLTALEAMACGCAVIVPQYGGAIEFVRDRVNGLVADTDSHEACYNALRLLVDDGEMRKSIELEAMKDAARYFPEAASYQILKYLFDATG